MNAQDIRNAYLQYYKDRQHTVIARAALMLKDDPTTLFTGSGMQPLMPYLLGESHPDGVRLVDSQPCLRAQDIEDVGDNRHTVFFEMLGNWSLGDYFKADQLPWMYEFLLDVVKLDINKVYATCFIGNEEFNIPRDNESAELLKKIFADRGIEALTADLGSEEDGYARGMKPGERIFFYDAFKNWWWRGKGIAGMPEGEPGGPSSEMFYRFDESEHTDAEKKQYGEFCHPNCDCGRFMEIGNNVFMEYVRRGEGFEKLPNRNVDQGSGLERIAAAAIDSPDVFKISLMWPIIEKLEMISGKTYESNTNAMRVIADHLRGATFLAVDGCVPANKEQGYVMRRLLRRAIRFAFDLGIEQNFLEEIVPVIADLYHNDYPEVATKREEVIAVLVKEEKVFRQTLRKGLKQMEKFKSDGLTGAELFMLYDTYGFPVELSTEEAFKQEIKLSDNWRQEFDDKMAEQRARSQTAAKGTFKGGLGGQTLIHKKYHTATHLMYAALKQVLGDHVTQHGSNITEDRLRFDFNHDQKMTPEEIAEVERIVNEKINEDLPVFYKEYPTDEAFEKGAIGAFGDKYGDTVKVYQMGEGDQRFSFEICGGPHVDHTGELADDKKIFKITKEESSSAGIRRIKAVLK
ncbi:MAG: alanine--tRNA ligase [Candidatus Saccharibacteria bacterium]|nr:MAG: alanine--tRNA ligase [Candidatus Saccharibacteria bacterium]